MIIVAMFCSTIDGVVGKFLFVPLHGILSPSRTFTHPCAELLLRVVLIHDSMLFFSVALSFVV